MADVLPGGGIHRRPAGRVSGIRGGMRGGGAIRLDVKTAQADSFLRKFHKRSNAVKDWVALKVAERVKANAENRVERQSVWPGRFGKGGRPRKPTNILRPSLGGQAIGIVKNTELGPSSGRGRTTGYTVYVSSGQAHLLEYGVDPHWQRMRRVPHSVWAELGALFASKQLNKRSPWRFGLMKHPGHRPAPFMQASYKSARGWLNRQGRNEMVRRFQREIRASRSIAR